MRREGVVRVIIEGSNTADRSELLKFIGPAIRAFERKTNVIIITLEREPDERRNQKS